MSRFDTAHILSPFQSISGPILYRFPHKPGIGRKSQNLYTPPYSMPL